MRHLFYIFILTFSINLFGVDYIIDTVSIHSNKLNEDRTILVFKPVDLIVTDSVSIIYLLDGEFSDYRYKKLQSEIPNKQTIGIGIINTNRNRDMLPAKQADRFLSFIETELIPEIELGYLLKMRILYGHSFAGGFTVFSLINSSALFNKYIASSPTPIKDFVDPDIYEQLDKGLENDCSFFFSYGTKDMKQVRKWSAKLTENLSGLSLMRINWKNEVYEGENHNTSDLISLTKGLQF